MLDDAKKANKYYPLSGALNIGPASAGTQFFLQWRGFAMLPNGGYSNTYTLNGDMFVANPVIGNQPALGNTLVVTNVSAIGAWVVLGTDADLVGPQRQIPANAAAVGKGFYCRGFQTVPYDPAFGITTPTPTTMQLAQAIAIPFDTQRHSWIAGILVSAGTGQLQFVCDNR
jgi:hypothetical protein